MNVQIRPAPERPAVGDAPPVNDALPSDNAPPFENALSMLLGLIQRARRARTADELAFLMVNETIMLAPYRQSLLWRDGHGVAAVSGIAVVDRNAPFILWANRLCKAIRPTPQPGTLNQSGTSQRSGTSQQSDTRHRPFTLTEPDVPPNVAADWREFLPEHCLMVPLAAVNGNRLGIMLFVRDDPWSENEILFIAEAAETYALAWAFHLRPTPLQALLARWRRVRGRHWLITAVLLGVACMPVHLSVLAPGEVVARDPAVVRAPLEGVVDHILVEPNQDVAAGQLLFELDTTAIRGKLEVAQKALQTAHAEYEQAAQQAFSDSKAKAQLGVLTGRIDERRAEVTLLSDQLARSRVVSPRAGVAVLDDPSEWIGRPVAVGERVLAVADEHDTELEAWLAPADMIPLADRAPVTLFLNTDPLHPVHAILRSVGYETMMRPDGSVAHRVRASLTIARDRPGPGAQDRSVIGGEDGPRLGLKGTARLDGDKVPLAYWLLRRPLAAARQTLGL